MVEVVQIIGIWKLFFEWYIVLQGGSWGLFVSSNVMLWNWFLVDFSFVFKVFIEIVIDFGCVMFVEVQKRGKDFWNEFEFYFLDFGVGIVLDIVFVGMLVLYVSFGRSVIGVGFRVCFFCVI